MTGHCYTIDKSGWEKWDGRCHDLSLQYKKNFPKTFVEGYCNRGKRHQMSYRQLHAVVADFFFAKRLDVRFVALDRLLQYQCENQIACIEFKTLLEETASRIYLKKFSKKLFAGLQKLREKLKLINNDNSLKKRTNGLCLSDSHRTFWLEKLYQLYCPLKRSAWGGPRGMLMKNPIKDSTTETLKLELEQYSFQAMMSSSFVDSFQHLGQRNDCSKEWKVLMTCKGALKTKYEITCRREKNISKLKPQEIHCKEKDGFSK